MRFSNGLLAGVAMISGLSTQPLSATVLMHEYEITASSFMNFKSDPAPFNTLKIRIRVSYDEALNQQAWENVDFFEAMTDGLLNQGPFSTPALFRYNPADNGFSPRLVIAGNASDPINPNINPDFFFSFDPTASDPRYVMGSFKVSGKLPFTTTNAVFKEVAITSAVPEPATWAMMIFGFGAVGAVMRRQRKNVRFTCA